MTLAIAAVMHRTAQYFITFTPKCWLWQPLVPNKEQHCSTQSAKF